MEPGGTQVDDQQVTESNQVSQLSLDINKLAKSMRSEMEMVHSFSDQCCIYRVPIRLRESNEKPYTPQVVSIGPFHHGKEELKEMEEHKLLYLQDFLKWSKASMEDLIKVVEERESRLRNCYAEAINLSSEEFVKMMLLDASFIIVVFLKDYYEEDQFKSKNDRIFNKPWKLGDITLDMSLMENQLPFFILDDLFKASGIASCVPDEDECSMINLTYEFFEDIWDSWLTEGILKEINFSEVAHFVDFIRKCQNPGNQNEEKLENINELEKAESEDGENELEKAESEDGENELEKSESEDAENKLENINVPSITELHQAGVKFRTKRGKNLLDMKFERGILEMPILKIEDSTEILFKNLQAFEQCHCEEDYIGNYISIINFLVITSNDVEILVRNGIIENWIHDNEAVTTLLHNISKENDLSEDDFIFASLVNNLNAYCRRPWNKWKAILKQEYFHTPWAIISVIAAVILLILTVVQTVCSLLQI